MSVKVLVPMPITDAMLVSSTVAEPAAGETTWVSAGNYALNDERIRTGVHRKFKCVLAHTGITTFPENDSLHWKDIGATMKWAMFDPRRSNVTLSTTALTVVLSPGFFDAVCLYKLIGANVAATVKDAPGGTVIRNYSGALDGPYADWWEWLFSPYRYQTKLVLSDIVPYPNAELTITVTAAAGAPVGIGICAIGNMRSLVSAGEIGGMKYGATAEPVDYSYIKTDPDTGDTIIVKKHNSTDMAISVHLPANDGDYALSTLQEVLAVPACWIATESAGYDGLNVFGLGSGKLTYSGPNHRIFDIQVKGLLSVSTS